MQSRNIIKEEFVFSSSLSDIKQNPIVDHLVHYRNMFAAPEFFIRRKVDYSKMRVFNEKLRKESERLETFKNFNPNLKHLIDGLVKSGFYCIENEFFPDQVKCIFCQGLLENWSKNDVPMKRHKHSYPTCPFIISLNVANEPSSYLSGKIPKEDSDIGKFNKDCTLKIECFILMPKLNTSLIDERIDHLNIDWREGTFIKYTNLTHLASSGVFVRTIKGEDFLECCWCKKMIEILDGVESLDETNFHNKNCQIKFLTAKVEDVIKSDDSKHFCDVEYSVTSQEVDARTETSLIYELTGKRFVKTSKDDIKSVIEKRLKENGKDFESVYEFLKAIKQYSKEEKKSSTSELKMSSVTLSEFQCVVCLDKAVEIIFLPCGHLKTCESCSKAMVTCPVCREMIERRVKNMRFNDPSCS